MKLNKVYRNKTEPLKSDRKQKLAEQILTVFAEIFLIL